MLLPLILVPVAGALGGAAYYMADPLRRTGGWQKVAANFLTTLLYGLVLAAAFTWG